MQVGTESCNPCYSPVLGPVQCLVGAPVRQCSCCRASGICLEHSQAQWHPDLRRTAYDCLMRMAAAVAGLDAAINLALDAVEQETAPLVRYTCTCTQLQPFNQLTILVFKDLLNPSRSSKGSTDNTWPVTTSFSLYTSSWIDPGAATCAQQNKKVDHTNGPKM